MLIMSINTVIIFWTELYWFEIQYTFWHFHFLKCWTIAGNSNQCTTLSGSSKHILEFLGNAVFRKCTVNYASYNLHIC